MTDGLPPVTHTAVIQGKQGCHVANLLQTFHHVPDTRRGWRRTPASGTVLKRSIEIRATIFVIWVYTVIAWKIYLQTDAR